MALTKVSGGILDPGIDVAGIVTATGFDGPFIGGSGKNIVAGIITCTELDLNGNGNISGNLVVEGNLTANGDFTTLNTTLREVELLRVDANSSAIAGIITQRGSGDIFSVYDTSTEVFKIADGGTTTATGKLITLDTITTGKGSGAHAGNAQLWVERDGINLSTEFSVEDQNTNAHICLAGENAHVRLQMGTEDVSPFSGWIQASYDNTPDSAGTGASGITGLKLNPQGGIVSTGAGLNVTGNIQAAGLTILNQQPKIYLTDNTGSPNDPDYLIQVDGGQFLIYDVTNTSNKILINADGHIDILPNTDFGAGIDVTGNSTFSDNVSFTTANGNGIIISKSGNYMAFGNSVTQYFGGTSMWLQHNGSTGYLHNVTGGLYIRNEANNGHVYIQGKSGADSIIAKYEAAVELYHNGTPKLETTSAGAKITGNLELSSTYPSLTWTDTNHNSDFRITNDDGKLIVYDITRGAHVLDFLSTGDLHIRNDKGLYFGESNDLLIGHDGSSTRINDNFGYLNITSNILELKSTTGSEFYASFVRNGSAKLYYDGTERFATSGIGVTVTGEVAASQDYPITKPVLDFNFAAEKKLDPRIQFTRASVATFIDKKGIVRYVSDNQPRFDHHPTSGVSLGLLLEKQSINYQPYSVDMSQGANNNGVTVENNAAIAPDGTMSASKITGGTNQNTSQRLGWGTQGVASNSYTMWSIWLKSEETSCIIQIYSNTYTFGADVLTVELADGTMGGHSGDFGDTTFRYNLEKYPNKWWRLSWGGNGNAGGNSGGMYVAVVPAMNSARAANTGSAHSKVWYAWGLQEEVGTQAKFATSYIPTNGSAVTRAADRGTIDGDDFNDFFDRYQGAVVHEVSNAIQSWTGGGSGWEFNNDNYQYNVITNIGSGYSHNAYPGGYAVAHGESSDTGTNSMSQFAPSSATGNQGFNYGYYAGRYPSNSNVDYNRLYKTYTDGMSWDITNTTNTLISATGGFSSSGTNTNNISHRNISKFELGSDANDMDGSYQKFSGRIKRWMYYDKALTANQLRNLTAQDPVTYL